MTNPTSNFGWQMPTASDLVTDLPADFEVFGQAVDTSLADLKGGTTGQILSKASNTDMDFTWVATNPGDITGVTAGTGISGGGTSGDVTITNSMATAIDAKGDLIAGTGADAFSRLAVGTNNQLLTADSTTATGLKWADAPSPTFNTGYNYVATGQTTTSSTYTDLATVQSVTVTTGTKALVNIQATIETSTATRRAQISFAVSGATTVAAAAQRGSETTCVAANNFFQTINYTQVITGLTAGSNTFTIKFASPTADSMFFRDRTISVVNLGS